MRSSFFLLLLFFTLPASGRVETGQGIFFPRPLARRIEAYSSFPLTWWNFLTFDFRDDQDLVDLRQTCSRLRQEGEGLFALIACGEDLRGFEPLLRDWARDIALRSPMPQPAVLRGALQEALARASLPLPKEVLGLLRFDPLGTYRDYKTRMEARSPIQLPRREGFFVDDKAHRALIPVKLAFPPADTANTEKALGALERVCGDADHCARWGFIGSHASNFTNQQRIRSDVTQVSRVGTLLLVAGLLALALVGRWRLLLLVPIVAAAVAFSAFATNIVFGSLHGLTIAFGSSIVGLALDYGFHRALNHQKYVGRSNLFGLLTTVGALLVLMLSEVPLIRQMMFFSAVGIVTAFILIEIAYRRWRLLQGIAGFSFAPRAGRWGLALTGIWFIGVALGVERLQPSFDLAKFNFQTDRDRQLMFWLAEKANLVPPLFIVDSEGTQQDHLAHAVAAVGWARERFRVENPAVFLPPLSDQTANLASWQGSPCSPKGPISRFGMKLSANWQSFFAPFLESLDCEHARVTGDGQLPAYVADYQAKDRWLTLFFPITPESIREVKTRYPDATSLREVVEVFPKTLSRELQWMVPLSLLLILGLLVFYYRHWGWALLPLIPFFTGIGFSAWLAILFHLDVSFVTLIGLVMLCGLSVDYGIFATDAVRFGTQSTPGAWSAILIAAAATLSGFAPLLFCRHQVLVQLGQVLSAGTVGTILGAWWGIPSAARWLRGNTA